ncbi:MAG: sulfatase [Thermoanaerobaculia bacterium]
MVAVVLMQLLGCGGGTVEQVEPAAVRLISEAPQRTLVPGVLGDKVVVLGDDFTDDAWRPSATAADWRLEDDALVFESTGAPFDLVRSVRLDTSSLHSVEVSLESEYRVRLRLSWERGNATEGTAGEMVLEYDEGRGEQRDKTFVFDLLSHPQWSGTITSLRLRLEPAPQEKKIAIRGPIGFRHVIGCEQTAERARQAWGVEIDHEIRGSLLVPPGLPVTRDLRIPENGTLRFGLGVTGRLSAAIIFQIRIALPGATPAVVFETRLEPAASGSRRWTDFAVGLGAYAGQSVRMTAESRVGNGFDAVYGVPAWANPEIVIPARSHPRPNIVLISIDTLRADRLTLDGEGRSTTPRLGRWARRFAVVFDNTIAPAPWTLPSHSSMLTGLDALTHGVNHPFRVAPPALTTVAERLRASGYFTAGITGGGWLHPSYGLAQGYDRYRTRSESGRGDIELEAHVSEASRWLVELRQPFFLFLHTYDVHDFKQPHRITAEVAAIADRRARLTALYDRAVSHMDRQIGRLLERFESLGLRRRTILALTSDHGEDLGEDRVFGHGSLRDPVLRVPFVLESPDGLGAGRRVEDQVRTIDVAPTLLDLAGIKLPGELDGRSLKSLISGSSAGPSPVAVSYASTPLRGLSLRFDNRWKYVFDNSIWEPGYGRGALYRLPAESPESDDLSSDHPLAELLRDFARRVLEKRLAGLRIRIQNDLAIPFSGRIRADPAAVATLKSTDLDSSWMTRVDDGAAELTVPPGRGFHLLFERLGSPWLEIEAIPPASSGAGSVLDLEPASLPAAFRWTGSAWEPDSGQVGALVLVDWHLEAHIERTAPFEEDPELRLQLEALGYLQ